MFIYLYKYNKGDIQNIMVVFILRSLSKIFNGLKNEMNNTNVIIVLFLLQLVVIGKPISLLLEMLTV